MGQVTLVVEFEIEPGRLADFRSAAEALIDRTDSEVGTLRYDWHISEDGGQCVNLELFDDAAAFLVHHRHVADLVPAIDAAGRIVRFSVIGEVSDEVRTELAGTASGFFSLFRGVSR